MKIDSDPGSAGQMAGSRTSAEAPGMPARRAWLARGAVVATPVLASLASAPVHAAGVCVLPSGFISAATFLSRHPNAPRCVSNGPTFWRNSYPTWPTASPDTTTALFSDIFGGTLEGGMAGLTLKGVLDGAFTTYAKFCVAAYLNARNGTSGFPLNDSQATAVWRHFRGGPTTSLIPMSWTEATSETWLATLMDP